MLSRSSKMASATAGTVQAAKSGGESAADANVISTPSPPLARQRDEFLDYLKGFLIIVVVYGHVIQSFGYTGYGSFEDPIFQLIYIFHMPLFMLVSGYLSERTFKKYTFTDFFTRKVKQLLLPVVSWAFFLAILACFQDQRPASLARLPISFVKAWIMNMMAFWFIWGLFLNFLIVFICRQFKKAENVALLAANFLILVLPDSHDLGSWKFVFPFFCIGYLMSKANVIPFKLSKVAYGVTLAAALLIYWTWKSHYLVYVSGMGLTPGNLPIIMYRFFAGVVASLAVYEALKRVHAVFPSPLMTYLGQNTLALYIVELFFLRLGIYFPKTGNLLLFHLVIGPILSIAITVIILQLVKLVSKTPLTKLWFLGQETRKTVVAAT